MKTSALTQMRLNSSSSDWRRRYTTRLRFIDFGIVTWAVAGAFGIRFGFSGTEDNYVRGIDYVLLSVALVCGWWTMLELWGTRDARVLGSGTEEYKRVLAGSVWLFGLVAVVSYALRIDTARGFVGLAFPAGALGLLIGRWLVRQHLTLERKRGQSSARVLIIGGRDSAAHLIDSLLSAPDAGYRPVGAHLPGAARTQDFADIRVPVTGTESDFEAILDAILEMDVDAVAVSAGVNLHPKELRRLGWELAARDIGMILAPALTDVAGPRIHTQPVAGLPLIHVSTPKLTGGKQVAKRSFDIAVAGLLVAFLSPLFLLLALMVKLSDGGSVLFRQERIGLRGTTFEMLKFRSMSINADAQLHALLTAQGSGSTPLFKVSNDPRITPLGRVLRKYSLDELPQLLNVLGGSMSLVGPRPQRQSEVALYDDAAHRRLYVKPGMSGLWQVSGRSNLTWEESIRLDLYYVENWSLMGDIIILFKTFKAVFASNGAV